MINLFPVIDSFVIIESQSTFSGLPKRLFYMENEQRLAKFYLGVEAYTRSKGLDMAIREVHPREGDWILLSDLDEILPPMSTPSSWAAPLSMVPPGTCSDYTAGSTTTTRSSSTMASGSVLSCSANREQESHETRKAHGFGGPEYDDQRVFLAMIGDNQWRNAGYYMGELRNSPALITVEDACWHCSWCFDRMESYVDKMKSYSHTEHNKPQYQAQKWIITTAIAGSISLSAIELGAST
ncbi:hypothetical protein BG006_009027 [Podila minutissima]|uniref:Uncharacterized protein n=1 Tax=Podila minutissima TaxID=64525 RepID=A0A9P5SJ90_9FUNG|nr:hypothetical protein BG006_009027 [Podila minutissima]